MLISYMHLLTEEDFFLEVTARDANLTRFLSSSHIQLQCPWHLQPPGNKTQPVQERGGKCKKYLRGGR